MADAIRIDHMSRVFDENIALEDVSCAIDENEVVAVIGKNGSGKSTLLKTMIGLLRPTTGLVKMRMEGTHFREVYSNRRKAKRYSGFGSQNPSFYEELTVEENLQYYASLHDLAWGKSQEYMNTLLRKLSLTDKEHEYAHRLSGGMKKRLDIACACVHRPRYLFLDEPASDLDPGLRQTIWDVLQWLKSEGATVLFSTHYIEDLHRFTDRVIILQRGRVAHDGTPEALEKEQSGVFKLSIRLDEEQKQAVHNDLQHPDTQITYQNGIVSVKTSDLQAVFDVLTDHGCLNDVVATDMKKSGLRELI